MQYNQQEKNNSKILNLKIKVAIIFIDTIDITVTLIKIKLFFVIFRSNIIKNNK